MANRTSQKILNQLNSLDYDYGVEGLRTFEEREAAKKPLFNELKEALKREKQQEEQKVYKNPVDLANAIQKPAPDFKYWNDDEFNNYTKGLEYGGRKGDEAHYMAMDDIDKALSARGVGSPKIQTMQDLVNKLKSIKSIKDYRLKSGHGEYNPELIDRDKLPANYGDQYPDRSLASLDDSYIGSVLRDWGYEF